MNALPFASPFIIVTLHFKIHDLYTQFFIQETLKQNLMVIHMYKQPRSQASRGVSKKNQIILKRSELTVFLFEISWSNDIKAMLNQL